MSETLTSKHYRLRALICVLRRLNTSVKTLPMSSGKEIVLADATNVYEEVIYVAKKQNVDGKSPI